MGCRIMLVTAALIVKFARISTLALTEPMIHCNGSYIYQPAQQQVLSSAKPLSDALTNGKILARVYPLNRQFVLMINNFQADELQ